MKNIFKTKVGTIIVLLSTLALAGVAIFTAVRLYQLRNQAVAPTAPTSKPAAAAPKACTTLAFSLTTASPSGSATASPSGSATASPSGSATASPTTSPSSTPNPECNDTCTSNSQCPGAYTCYIPSGASVGNCRNAQCLPETDCTCATTTSTPTPSASSEPSLPEAGTSWPTIVGSFLGILLVIGSIVLAL